MIRRRALVWGAILSLALLVVGIAGATGSSPAPTAIALSGTYGPQDFNSMTTAAAPQTWPAGWQVNEQGTASAANGLYVLGTGSGNAGDTYSFASTGTPADKALGALRSGTNAPYIGARFTNTTGATITSLDVSYRGEQWRLGQAGRGADQLDLQYSVDATDPFTGNWTYADSLDFFSLVASGTAGALDGNTNSQLVTGTVDGLSIPAGATFWLRWLDVDASGSDDGLAVDNVTVTPHGGPVNRPMTATCGSNITAFQGSTTTHQVSASDPDGTVSTFSLDRVVPAAAGITIGGVTAGSPATATVSVAGNTPTGTYTAIVRATNTDSPAQAAVCSFNITVTTAPTTVTIGAVQGSLGDTADPATFDSPRIGTNVTVRGVVTELTYEQSSSGAAQNGFFIQDGGDGDPNSSDGVYVFTGSNRVINGYTPAAGDEIFLTAAVDEFFGLTELKGPFTVTPVSTGNAVAPVPVPYPADARWWERHEGMQVSVPAQSVVTAPTHLFASTQDTEFYVVPPGSPVAQRANPYAQRTFRDAHPLDGSADKIDISDEGIKASDHSAKLVATHTFQKTTAPIAGGVYFAFSKYSVSATTQPAVVDGVDPSQNDAPVVVDRARGFSVANFNVENLYDYRDDPTDGCDFPGNTGCPGVTPPFDYTPASDAEYQGRETEIAHQIVDDLHSPDVIVVAEAEDQDICHPANGSLDCSAGDGKPDTIQELALHVQALGGPVYDTAFDRNGADARGIICAFMFRSDRVSLIPADASDPVLGSSPGVQYAGQALSYNTDVSNPKALNAKLPDSVIAAANGDTDGTNVFTRAVQVAHFTFSPTTLPGYSTDVWVAANHFSSGPDSRVLQRTEQATYDAQVVKAIQAVAPNAKIVVAGDLNVFPRPDDPLSPPSDQLHSLYDAGLHNMYDTVLAHDPAAAYSYTFDGNAQDLDHQFVSDSLFATLKSVHEAHINADWPRVPGSNRGTSDHDPMVTEWALRLASPPVAHANGPYAVDEGSTVALHATADDADPLDTATYAWDLDGNGTFETLGQDVTVPAPDGPATPNVTVQVTDSFGLTSTDTAVITIRNVAPTATFTTSSDVVTAGQTVSLSLTNPSDPSAADTTAGFEYAFDCGTGFGPFAPTSTAVCDAPARGVLSVGGQIRDRDGDVSTYTAEVTVNGRSPLVSAGGPYTVDEGGTVTLAATGHDPDGDEPITYEWDLDNSGTFETPGTSVAFHAGDGPATVTVTVRGTDTTGATGTSSATITIRNVAPTATFQTPATATVGVPFTIALTDPHDYDTALQYAFDCGAGYGPYGAATSASCTTVAAGALTVHGSVRDKDGGVHEYTATVNVGVTFAAVCELAKAYAAFPQASDKVCNDLDRAAKFADKGRHSKQVDDALDQAAKDVAKWGGRGGFLAQQQAVLLALLAKL